MTHGRSFGRSGRHHDRAAKRAARRVGDGRIGWFPFLFGGPNRTLGGPPRRRPGAPPGEIPPPGDGRPPREYSASPHHVGFGGLFLRNITLILHPQGHRREREPTIDFFRPMEPGPQPPPGSACSRWLASPSRRSSSSSSSWPGGARCRPTRCCSTTRAGRCRAPTSSQSSPQARAKFYGLLERYYFPPSTQRNYISQERHEGDRRHADSIQAPSRTVSSSTSR